MSIQNVVVLMLENRSYDNVFGALYAPGNPPPFNAAPAGQQNLNGLTLSGPNQNSNPNGTESDAPAIPVANQATPTQIGGKGPSYPPTTIPLFDPGEYFEDMAQQILGLSSVPTSDPYGSPAPDAMGGFVNNYKNLDGLYQNTPDPSNVADVMNYFTPQQVPVSSFLARNYAVSDTWFASVPTQTYTNRAFALTAAAGVNVPAFLDSAHSFVDDEQYSETLQQLPSLLQQMDLALSGTSATPPYWKLYFHDFSIGMATVPYIAQQAALTNNQNVSTFDSGDNTDWGSTGPALGNLPTSFVADATSGNLPMFSFIEPRYGHSQSNAKLHGKPIIDTPLPPNTYAPNSNHPGGVNVCFPVGGTTQIGGIPNPPIDVMSGELLLMQVYNLLYNNTAQWDQTLLIVVYDEHGGLYDHVPPPAAKPPGVQVPNDNTPIPAASDTADTAADNFNFTVFGARVPALFVSPLIAPGTAVTIPSADTPFDHTSIISTTWELFLSSVSGTPASLTNRDAAAPTITGVSGLIASAAVTPAAGPFGGMILCSPGSLLFSGNATQNIVAAAGNMASLSATAVQAGSEATWLTFTSTTATIAGGDVLYIAVTVDTSALPSGSATYTGTVLINGSDVSNSPMAVPVTLAIP